MMKINPYWDYFKYVLEHKKNVFKVCWNMKLYSHAITHDLSKFSPREFIPYAKYFYIDKEKYEQEFDKAWQHHYKNNPHHWQHWLDDRGEPYPMQPKYLQQMIADWDAMGIKFCDTAQKYYLNNYYNIKLHRTTRMLLEFMLGINEGLVNNLGHTLGEFANMFSEEEYNSCFGFIEDMYGINTYKLLNRKEK